MFWAIGGFFLVLTPIVLVHEYGHFIAARLSNIKVDEFGLGFPPRAMTLFERNGTVFSLNWIPLGGFVRPAGEDDPTIEGGLAGASKRARFFVLIAGALANFIFALIIFWIMYMLPQPMVDESVVIVNGIAPGSPAETAGLQQGDQFVEVNSLPVDGDFGVLTEEIQANLGNDISLLMERNGELLDITLVPRTADQYDVGREGAVGVLLSHPETGEMTRYGAGESVVLAAGSIGEIIYMTIRLPIELIQGTIAPSEARVVSVVGISQMAGQATQQSVETGNATYLLSLAGVISVALGFTNLLPIPALDGGRILFVIVEAIRGRRIEPEQEGMIHAVGMALLLGLMVILIYQDVVNPIIPPS